ncbi:hypothetical protein Tsubulata_020801 [Turnera subulata]|uniref:Nucleoside phosphorylase domain-containing protein n=1 Tax=Turnera subulata TaxID=218843 RepID=A0A9Q0FHG4_9ROSI|nr:hypothetical protein Tsubulata_020801 [Turnera subulata]
MYLTCSISIKLFNSQDCVLSSHIFLSRIKDMGYLRVAFVFILALILLNEHPANGAIPSATQKLISKANKKGPYLGLVIPNLFEMNPLLQSPSYKPSDLTIDFSGRRFRFGTIGEKKVILVMTGLGMINSAITTQLLLTNFNIEGVVHYGIAGNANPSLHIGDVVIPQSWAHLALWNWQRYGQGPKNVLPLEANGDYTREFGFIKVANYSVNVEGCSSHDNLLNNICFIYNKFNVSPVEMESAAVALISSQQKVPFIVIRALSDLAGGGDAYSNEADTFISLAATNSIAVVLEFIHLLSSQETWVS